MSSNYRSYSRDLTEKSLQKNLDLKVLVAQGGVENFVLYKLLSTQCPKYLSDIVPYSESFYDTHKKQTFFRLQN